MSGGFWAGNVPPWASVILVLTCAFVFVLGIVAGMEHERRAAERDAREERAEEEAGQRRTHLVYELDSKPDEDRFAAIREAGRRAWQIQQERAAGQQAHEAWLAHCEQAVDLASDERRPDGSPIDTGEIRAFNEQADEWLGRLLAEHPVPYPDGDQ